MDGLEALATGAIISPFTRLRQLLQDIPAGHGKPVDLTLGEPRETMPPFIAEKIGEAEALFAKYPPMKGSGAVDGGREVLPVNGSREGLYFAALPAVGRKKVVGRPAILICNPYYQAYIGAALATGAEPIFLNATSETGHLPDLDEIAEDKALLERTVAFYLCSPANPQGAIASRDYVLRALELARAHDFMLFFDECYSELYNAEPPVGGLEVAATTPERYSNIVVFNSLSKRSNLPGLRSGFCAGDGAFIETLAEVRNLVGPTMPGPVQHASAAAWSEEQHVVSNRMAYRAKFDVCDEVLAGRYGYRRPGGGFFLWLDLSHFGGGVEATVTLWKRSGVRVIPGAYLAQPGRNGVNPGTDFVRVALVTDPATIREALGRIVSILA
jgi:N-succinyldiaminopimelate aminotransferase